MNGLPMWLTVASILVGICAVALLWADERWTRTERELFSSCSCSACTGVRT